MLTSDEAAVYDRQIRLWGVTAQSRLRKSKICILGFTGLASEVVKTLVLAGVDSITIVDDRSLQDNDLTSNLFCRPDFITINQNGNGNDHGTKKSSGDGAFRTHETITKLKLLNPLVKIEIDNDNLENKLESFYKDFDLVALHTFTKRETVNKINSICRSLKIKFYLALDFGFFGAAFSDLGDSFTYSVEEEVSQTSANNQYATKTDSAFFQTLSDGEEDDDSDDGRPIKKARIDEQLISTTKEVVEKKLDFVPFDKLFSYEGDIEQFKSSTSPVLPMIYIMFEFYSKLGRIPSINFMEDDTSDLKNIAKDVLARLKFKDNVFDKVLDWSNNVFGSLSPICAIVGGVIGQDMIRTLSGRDSPICNLFLFDGLNMNGTIEKAGTEKMNKNNIVVPIDEIVL